MLKPKYYELLDRSNLIDSAKQYGLTQSIHSIKVDIETICKFL